MLLRAISGLIKVDGNIMINSKNVIFNHKLPENIGIMIEHTEWISYLTGFENLEYLAKFNKKIDKSIIEEYMKLFFLYEFKDKKVKNYSLGMKQKLSIIQAIMENQNLILLDEPTNGLDNDSEKVFKKIMLELKSRGKTIIIATHHKNLVEDISDAIIEINNLKVTNINYTKR